MRWAEAGRLVQRLPVLWAKADLSEKQRLLLGVVDAVYVDTRGTTAAVTNRPNEVFETLLGGAVGHASLARIS